MMVRNSSEGVTVRNAKDLLLSLFSSPSPSSFVLVAFNQLLILFAILIPTFSPFTFSVNFALNC